VTLRQTARRGTQNWARERQRGGCGDESLVYDLPRLITWAVDTGSQPVLAI